MPHVLVIDGEPQIRDVFLSQAPPRLHVTWAATREHGQRVLRGEAIGLVVLESRLPDGCGLELLSDIRIRHPALPVIVVTRYGSEAVCARAFKLGVRDYFAKPVEGSELLGAVRHILAASDRGANPGDADPRPPPTDVAGPGTGNPHVDLVVRVVHEHFDEWLTLGSIARTASTNVFSLSRTFSRVMGVSFRTYLLRLRVARAASLLETRNLPVADVAERVGFRDPSWFNKVFKRHHGVPPTVYRRRAERKKLQVGARNS